MTDEQKLLDALRTIAAIPLWGEPITNPEQGDKEELAEHGEYDLENNYYTPSVDTESSLLTYAVETARKALAFTEYLDAVDAALKKLFGFNMWDAGIETGMIARAKENGETPEDFALRFGEKYGLTLISEWQFR